MPTSPNIDNSDKTPLVTNLSPSPILTREDLEIIFNLSDEDISHIAQLRPSVANNEYLGSSLRERVTSYLINRLAPGRFSDNNPTGLNESEQLLMTSYIRDRNAAALYDIIVNRTTLREKIRLSIAEDFKYTDSNGIYHEKCIPNPDMTLPDYSGERLTELKPLPQDINFKTHKPTNDAVFMYLRDTRGLSTGMINFLLENKYIYQGFYDTEYSKERNRWEKNPEWMQKHRILCVNGTKINPDGSSTLVFQSMRETWDVWDAYHTSEKFLSEAAKKPSLMYEMTTKKDSSGHDILDENKKKIWIKKQKMIESRNQDGSIIKDSRGNNVYEPAFDPNGNPIYVKKTPLKKDRTGSDKSYTWRLSNPNMNTLYIFEAPLDCWSFIDMLVQDKQLYTPERKVDTSKLANFLTLGGLNMEPIRSFMRDNPHITKICLCFDNDKAGKNASILFKKQISQQYNIPPENIFRYNCPSGYQKLDITFAGMRDENNKMIEVKDYNELLRAWVGAGHVRDNMARMGEDYIKDNGIGKYGTKQYQITEESKQDYIKATQKPVTSVQSFENIPPVPEKRGGLDTAALYRDARRESMRASIINSMRDDGLSAQEKYKKNTGITNGDYPVSSDVNISEARDPREDYKGGDER